MCGILGQMGRDTATLPPGLAHRLAHRGPDGEGEFLSPAHQLALYHTRLAIQDPTPLGAQPMHSAGGRLTIVFNGEIYNFRELRDGLVAAGHQFASHTDTEVLLALYEREGTEMLARLNGIFAFALWDAEQARLFVARDGCGVKPLYYSEAGGAFAFASEIKALLAFDWIPRTIDPQAVAHYLQFLWCPAPRTPLAAVRKLLPGEAVVVEGGRIVRRWNHYALPAPGADESPSIEAWTTGVREAVATAVQRQMVSDVPLGAFLSGGLDSSAIVAEARKHCAGRLQCFTLDFDARLARQEGFTRDLPYAQAVAKHLDVDLHVVEVGPGMADELEAMVWQLDEPQADLAALNVLHISRLARSHGIKVLLSGAGGDDVFTGYRRHRALGLDAAWRSVPAPLRQVAAALGERLPARPAALRRARKLLSAAAQDGDARLAAYFDWARPDDVAGLMAPRWRGALGETPLLDALTAMPATATPLQRMLLLEQRYFLADHNLNYTDKMSMAAGVEARVPFLDPDLMALAARIPDRYRQRGAEGKWILKKAMEGILPHDVIYRPKTGFGVPLRAWLAGPLAPLMDELLSPGTLANRGLFDAGAVAMMREANARGRADHGYTLLALMCIELWCRRFVDPVAVPAPGAALEPGVP
jgi:asparagine synthase (glutamine-hydrolysing)